MIQLPAAVVRSGATRFAGPAVLLTALVVSGCGSSGGGNKTSAPPSSAPASSAPAGGTADAASTTAITKAYVIFFNSTTKLAASETVLQHGAVFKATLATQAKSPAAKGLSATVSKVVLQSPNLATVTFSLLSSGKALLANTPGYAVKEGATWKVAAGTFCALLTLQGGAPKACDDTSITALPS